MLHVLSYIKKMFRSRKSETCGWFLVSQYTAVYIFTLRAPILTTPVTQRTFHNSLQSCTCKHPPNHSRLHKQHCLHTLPSTLFYLSFNTVWPTLKRWCPSSALELFGFSQLWCSDVIFFVRACIYLLVVLLQWTCCIKPCTSLRPFGWSCFFSFSGSVTQFFFSSPKQQFNTFSVINILHPSSQLLVLRHNDTISFSCSPLQFSNIYHSSL